MNLASGTGSVRMGLFTFFRLFSCRQYMWACFLALLKSTFEGLVMALCLT